MTTASRAAAVLLILLSLAGCTGTVAPPKPTPDIVEDDAPPPSADPTPTAPPIDPTDVPVDTGFHAVFDDTEHIGVSVPVAWDDVSDASFEGYDGEHWYRIYASPDAEAFPSAWDIPGIELAAAPLGPDLTTQQRDDRAWELSRMMIDDGANDEVCTVVDDDRRYEDELYVGYYNSWADCEYGGSDLVTVTAYDRAGTHLLFFNAVLVSDADKTDALHEILRTFQARF